MRWIVDTSKADLRTYRWLLLPNVVRRRFNAYAAAVVLRAQRNVAGSILGFYRGRRPTRQLARNISFRSWMAADKVYGEIGTGIPPKHEIKYAAIHEFGGTIRPRTAKFLTIPFPGVQGQARNYGDTEVVKTMSGKLLIIQKTGRGFAPLFLLVKEVRMPARRWLSRSMDEESMMLRRIFDPPELQRAIEFGEGGRED